MKQWMPMVVLVALAAACSRAPDPQAAPTPAAETVTEITPKIVSPQVESRAATLQTTGKVQFNEDALVRVHAPATGRVLEVFARPGDFVETGARLLVLDSADLGSAKADYAKAVADVERAEAALRLARELLQVNAVAAKEVREADNDARKAAAERERAAARLRTLGVTPERLADIAARADASTTITLTASRSGVVVERNVTPGQVVSYGQSDTPLSLFVVADLSTVWVVADVYEPDVARLRRGQPMVVTLRCCPGERYEGTVGYIGDAVDKETRTVKVRAVVPNRGRPLKAEMFVNVTVTTGTEQMVTIPQSAVHREGQTTFVLLVKNDGQRERRVVRLGADLGERIEVVSGVGVNDRLVGTGSILLKGATK